MLKLLGLLPLRWRGVVGRPDEDHLPYEEHGQQDGDNYQGDTDQSHLAKCSPPCGSCKCGEPKSLHTGSISHAG